MTESKKTPTASPKEAIKLKGKYVEATGRRKTASAIVRVYPKGTGQFIVNGKALTEFFAADKAAVAKTPLKLTESKDFDISVLVHGGGKQGQAEAIRHGIAHILVKMDETLKPILKAKSYLTRDSRKKERKKPGLRRARRAPQWSKR